MFESRFQSFDETANPAQAAPRLAALRARLSALGLTGLLVPRADAHQNEYVPPGEERLAWLTGFTGSFGLAVVLKDRAGLFVDGRYTVQVRQQTDTAAFTPLNVGEVTPADWLRHHVGPEDRIGFDPWLHTPDAVRRFEKACADAGAELVPVEPNPLDDIWDGRPAAPLTPVVVHPMERAGEESGQKLARIQDELKKLKADALLVTDPHVLAWTFNIRGGDVAHTPLPLGWAIIPADGRPTLLIDGRKLSNAVRDHLASAAEVDEPARLDALLDELGARKARVRIDPAAVADRLAKRLEAAGAVLDAGPDPVVKLKAVKNPTEVAGARSAHIRDGVAMARFLHWLDQEGPKGTIDEIIAAQALETFRRETGALKDVSFPSISAAGQNAALPHYRVTRSTNRLIEPGFYLIDSGAQYEDGTTDITRTVEIAGSTEEMKDRYTRVLKGHIAIATARFPKGATGAQLDSFARRPLWDIGTDFDHGTGHGVGSYLSVHEGPHRISKLGHTVLEPGNMLSNEPGYYKEGHYGIRIENLVIVREASFLSERPFYEFETITLAPIDTRPVLVDLLTADERAWLNAYHAHVAEVIAPLVDDPIRPWLLTACRPV